MTLTPLTSMAILWMDGEKDTFPFTHQEVKDGELHVWTYHPGNRKDVPPVLRDEYFFPLCNIRARQVTRGDGTARGGQL